MSSTRLAVVAVTVVAGCGGGTKQPRFQEQAIALYPAIAEQTWYRARSTCAQGPYELDVATTGARWGEEIELRLHTPRKLALHAMVVLDGAEVRSTAGVFDARGKVGGAADNTRCIADARERLTLGRAGGGAGGGTGTGTPATPGTRVPIDPPATPSATAELELDTGMVTTSITVVHVRLPDRAPPGAKVRIRFWSVEPNDLTGVLFGAVRIHWRPNVSDAAYEAHLAARAAREDQARRQREEQWRRDQARAPRAAPRPVARVEIDADAELAAYKRREEERRRRAVAVALEAERRARRKQFCAAHPDDRDCWGAGGMKVHLELDDRQQQRLAYCAANPEDARCWTTAERQRREIIWNRRVATALAPPKPPDGPPPAPLVETVPPKLSVNADWRPGYWHWLDGTWVWLAGMWRVPEADIVAEQTTTAPAAPPPAQHEAPPIAPVRTAVWLGGFWQWNGTAWVWIPGSWQLRPEPRVMWRAPTWQPRGRVHVLIPGGWVRREGGR